jgi:hypothetical protein
MQVRMNKEVEIRIPERQINKNEVPKYSKFVFMWWFDFLNGFQLIFANRNSLKKKISYALSVIGFLISILCFIIKFICGPKFPELSLNKL